MIIFKNQACHGEVRQIKKNAYPYTSSKCLVCLSFMRLLSTFVDFVGLLGTCELVKLMVCTVTKYFYETF